MQEGYPDAEILKSCSKFDVSIPEEASYILWYIWKDRYPAYASLPTCISTLSRDEDLYAALKVAHSRGEYDAIRNWKGDGLGRDEVVEGSIQSMLTGLRPAMERLVRGDIVLPAWDPTFDSLLDEEVVDHLAGLGIPALKGKPNLLLHDLGSFTKDSLLDRRLKNIFMPNNHTFLVNTSGSGKTRLLLEGLCHNWGFYFTSLVDSSLLGSHDVQNSIRSHVPDDPKFRPVLSPAGSPGYETALNNNRAIANRIFRQIFLSRLIVFNFFAETMNKIVKFDSTDFDDLRVYKSRWLLLQLQPSFVHRRVWDIFDELSSKLSKATDSFINTKTKTLLASIRTLLCPEIDASRSKTLASISTSETGRTPIFCVLDEAQYAATQHFSAFRSDHNGAHRPILREIVKAWESQSFGQGVFMIVAGTGISKDVVDQAMASAIMKDSRYRWCSDTGAFDNAEVQQQYLRKYLPKSLLESDAGKRLVERVWYWLHGRYRFTAGYVAELLSNGFRRPHGLLNAYVEHFTNFSVTDASAFVKAEGTDPLPVLSQYRLDFSKLRKNSDMLSTIHQLTTHYLMRSVLPTTLGKDEATYVEYGFARFVDSETKTVAVNEPLVLLAATNWINANHRSSYKFFAKQIHLHDPLSNGFENYVAFCLDLIFSNKRRINEVFHFSGPAPPWASLEAELVTLYRNSLGMIEQSTVRHFRSSGPSVTLGINAKSPEATSSWLQHAVHAPFCFPHTSMGPDLILVLRLADASLIWVALQAKYSSGNNGILSRSFLRRAMRSVTPSFFFLDKEGRPFSPAAHPNLVCETSQQLLALPYRRDDAGRYSLLRVVTSFPADTNLKRCLEEDPDTEGHPIASLNMMLVKQVTRKLSPIDFLQGLEDPLQQSGKRKRRLEPSGLSSGSSSRSKRPVKKIRLNINT